MPNAHNGDAVYIRNEAGESMELSIRSLLGLTGAPAVETSNALFFGHVPNIAPYAYLHTIFLPPPPEVLEVCALALSIPDRWKEWLTIQNGAKIFSSALVFYGAVPPSQLLSRSSNYAQAPYSIETVNREPPLLRHTQYVQIGTYSFNAARLLLSRDDQSLLVVDRRGEQALRTWPDVESFLANEPSRLATLYSPSGKLLVDGSFTVPSAERPM